MLRYCVHSKDIRPFLQICCWWRRGRDGGTDQQPEPGAGRDPALREDRGGRRVPALRRGTDQRHDAPVLFLQYFLVSRPDLRHPVPRNHAVAAAPVRAALKMGQTMF